MVGLAAGATPPALSPFEDQALKGRATYSESAMVMVVSQDGGSAIALRFCRFPDAGVTWLWCHVLVAGRLLAFAHHRLPCAPHRLFATPDAARFETASPGLATLVRHGSSAQVRSVEFRADLAMHEGSAAPLGPGSVRLRLAGTFAPGRHLPPLPSGRQELTGGLRASLRIGDRTVRLDGPGKFHEQAQTGPRWVDPFSYLGFWGPELAGMMRRNVDRSAGGIALGDAMRAVSDYLPEPPGPVRRCRATTEAGEVVAGQLTTLTRFTLPIYGEAWRGSFVTGRLDGRPITGMMNDWRPEQLVYL